MTRPPIPRALFHRPTIGGLVCPWVNVTLADGGVDFRVAHQSKWLRAWMECRCQTCGMPIEGVKVFLGGDIQVRDYFDEPPLHPWCASYAEAACPMVAGRLTHYADRPPVSDGQRGKTCFIEGCDCGGWVPHNAPDTGGPVGGAPAHNWWAVWALDYALVLAEPDGRVVGGKPFDIRRTRLVSQPGKGLTDEG